MFKHSLCFGGKLTTSFISLFYIKKIYISDQISDQTNLQQLWRNVFSRSFWQNLTNKYLRFNWTADNAYITDMFKYWQALVSDNSVKEHLMPCYTRPDRGDPRTAGIYFRVRIDIQVSDESAI